VRKSSLASNYKRHTPRNYIKPRHKLKRAATLVAFFAYRRQVIRGALSPIDPQPDLLFFSLSLQLSLVHRSFEVFVCDRYSFLMELSCLTGGDPMITPRIRPRATSSVRTCDKLRSSVLTTVPYPNQLKTRLSQHLHDVISHFQPGAEMRL
jgi:hypothetical protein